MDLRPFRAFATTSPAPVPMCIPTLRLLLYRPSPDAPKTFNAHFETCRINRITVSTIYYYLFLNNYGNPVLYPILIAFLSPLDSTEANTVCSLRSLFTDCLSFRPPHPFTSKSVTCLAPHIMFHPLYRVHPHQRHHNHSSLGL